MKKYCIRCDELRDIEDYYKSSSTEDGIAEICNFCLYKNKNVDYIVIKHKRKLQDKKAKAGLNRCNKCRKWLEFNKFSRCKKSRLGLTTTCNTCQNKQAQKRLKPVRKKAAKARAEKRKLEEQSGLRICSKCYKAQTFDSFNKTKYGKFGLNSVCKTCRTAVCPFKKKKELEEELRTNLRICITCGKRKKLRENFYFLKQRRTYLRKCNPCVKKQHDKYREANKELYNAASKRWQKRNPEAVRAIARARKARKRGAEGTFTPAEWVALKDQYGYKCLCCGKMEPEIKLTVDHIVPISKGGSNWISNLQPLCVSCNSSKRDKTIDYRKGKK